jgi:hypothetical protein
LVFAARARRGGRISSMTVSVHTRGVPDQDTASTVARLFRPQNTPERLRAFRAVLFAAAAVMLITGIVVLQGIHSTAVSVRNTDAAAYLDVTEAGAVLSDADRAVWQSLRSGEAQFTGPGQTYEGDITTADQEFQRLAALEARGGAGSKLLPILTGQLVTYQGLVEQADAADRADIALGAGSHDLGYAYLGYAEQSLRDPGGLLATLGTLSGLNRQALNGRSRSLWADPALFAAFAAAGVVLLSLVVACQLFLRRRFRRMISSPLLLAAVLVCGLVAWMGAVALPADAALAAARDTALPRVVNIWRDQTQAVDAQFRVLQASASANAADAAGVLSLKAVQPASAALDADLVSAQNTGGLAIGFPIAAVVIAGLVFVALKPRLDEYRG